MIYLCEQVFHTINFETQNDDLRYRIENQYSIQLQLIKI